MARRRYHRRRRGRGGGNYNPKFTLNGLAFLVLLGFTYYIYKWVRENGDLIIGVVAFLIVIAVIGFLLYLFYKRRKGKAELKSLPEKIREVHQHLSQFKVDIPTYSKHSETVYQVDFGRYLKEHMRDDKILYEVAKESTRPDIVINNELAIEIKAMKSPDSEKARRYNLLHINSIFKKIHTYKEQYSEVIIIIFNASLVNNRNWRDYEKMKNAVRDENVHLFEK